ncbi:MAG: ABC transporter ATP-binding protein, partial [Butyricicoccus sp.]|nr:ABC transporter ATP-binding protein [Butyricicoccus sp.]
MNAIEIKNLSKSYEGFTLGGISLTLPEGAIMGLVGENGAGKSTTLRLIMNAITRDGGSVSVLGVDNRSPEFGAAKQEIGVVLDEAYFPEVLTARDVGRVMAGTYKNWDAARYGECLSRFALPEKKPFKEFSRGMKMKLAIAVALSHAPRLLILDEATSGLDPMMRDEILDIFNDFTRDETHSILMSSHIVSDLEKICDYIAFI